jgi:MEMO1 family protein
MNPSGNLRALGASTARGWIGVSLVLLACAERPKDRTASAASQHKTAVAPTQSPTAASTRESAGPSAHPQSASSAGAQASSKGIRRAQKAGGWYPEDRAWAVAEMQRMFRVARAAPSIPNKPLALVVPHAGWKYSGVAAAAAFRNLHPGDFERVVLLGPSHGHGFQGFSLPSFDAYETPLGPIPVCREAAELRDTDLVRDIAEADRGEHSLELELPWLQQTLKTFCIVPILVGSTSAVSERALAQKLARFKNERTLFVVSSDFVHYGPRFDYMPFGSSVTAAHDRIFDLERKAIALLDQQDPAGFRGLMSSTQATICGYRGQLVLLELLSRVGQKSSAMTFAHYSSADLSDGHDDSGSVGYVSLGLYDGRTTTTARPLSAPAAAVTCSGAAELDDSMGQRLLGLAKATLATELRGTTDLDAALAALPTTARLDCRQAVFVTLKARGQLRGCVGQVEPEYPLAEAVVRAAIDAAINDRRFEPVSPEELGGLTYEVTVLSVPHAVATYRDIVLGKHGIILSVAGRRALFLPQVPGEQGWGLEATLRALSNKAGLGEDAWQGKDAHFSVFTGTVFEEQNKPRSPARGNLGSLGGK